MISFDPRTIFSGFEGSSSLTCDVIRESLAQVPLSTHNPGSAEAHISDGGSCSHVAVFLSQYLRSTFHDWDTGYPLMTSLPHTNAFGKLAHSRLFWKHIQ